MENAATANASVSARRSSTAVLFTTDPAGAESAPGRPPGPAGRGPMSPYIAVTITAPATALATYATGRLKRWKRRGLGLSSSGSVSGNRTERFSRPVTLAGAGEGKRPVGRNPRSGLDSDMASTL